MNDSNRSNWLVVANPVAGRGKVLRLRARIEARLVQLGLGYRFAISEHRGHAVELVAAGIEAGFRNILAIGGDGTVNEVVNGIFGQTYSREGELTLAVLPLGTGNDWARGLGIGSQPETALEMLRTPRLVRHDIGVASFDDDGRSQHFINVAGVGFDAAVVERMPQTKRTLTYLSGLLGALMSYKPLPASIGIDQLGLELNLFVAFACLGRYCGGGMRVAPGAVADDGLFDLTAITAMSRLEVLRNLRRLFDGSLLDHPKVTALRGRALRFDAPQALGVELDGEWAGLTPVRFELLPQALAVVLPAASTTEAR